MNFGKGGQNIVQSGNNNPNIFRGAGGFFGSLLNQKLRMQERDYHRTKDEESRMRVNKANVMDKAGADIFKAMVLPGAAAHGATKAYAIANETLGEDHPDVVAGLKPADTLKHPEMAHQVNNYGFDVGWRPAKTPAGVKQAEARSKYRNGEESVSGDATPPNPHPDAGTVARFGEDGKINRQEITLSDIESGENKTERAPMSMRTEDSVAPTDRTWTSEEKSALENERPRTSNLNTGINDGKGGNN